MSHASRIRECSHCKKMGDFGGYVMIKEGKDILYNYCTLDCCVKLIKEGKISNKALGLSKGDWIRENLNINHTERIQIISFIELMCRDYVDMEKQYKEHETTFNPIFGNWKNTLDTHHNKIIMLKGRIISCYDQGELLKLGEKCVKLYEKMKPVL